MGKGNGFSSINPSCMMKGYTCKVEQRVRESGWADLCAANGCCALLSTFSMPGCKYDIFVSLGLSIGVQAKWGKGDCKFREIN